MGDLHRDAIIIDGLNISRWEHETFRAMHVGGLTAVNCTCCVWEGFVETMEAAAQWRAALPSVGAAQRYTASADRKHRSHRGRL